MIACDTDQTAPTVAREFWARAGVSEKIDLRIGPAINTLKDLLDKGCAGTFDVAYIDADKTNGMAYYELVLLLLRDNGLMAVDNVFWGGQVVSKGHVDRDTFAVRELNERIRRDLRVEVSVVPVGDGMLLARKVPQGDLPGVER
jgi:caffeoyl-CoA O-methyltransferase